MELVFCCTFWLFGLILAFAVIFDYLKKFFREGQRLNSYTDAEGRKIFFRTGTKFLMAFQKIFQGKGSTSLPLF